MSNMSYCRFENTFNDLKDCIEALNDINALSELSDWERAFAKRMVKACQNYIDSFEDFI